MAHYLRRHQKTCVTFSARGEDLVLKDRRLSTNYKRKYDFMKRTLIQCLHRTCSSTHARWKHKGDHFHLEGIGAPQLLREFINLYRWYFLNSMGFKFKMSLPSQSSPSRNYTSPFSGVVLLSLSVTGLQNSRLNRVECAFSTIASCVHLPGGVSFLSVYLRIYRCTAGTSPDCCSFLHFPYGLWYFSHNRLSILWFVAW